MRLSKNTLNNMMMDNQRRSSVYQTIITDLAIQGVVPRHTAEALLGYEIPEFLRTPDGKSFAPAKKQEPAKPVEPPKPADKPVDDDAEEDEE